MSSSLAEHRMHEWRGPFVVGGVGGWVWGGLLGVLAASIESTGDCSAVINLLMMSPLVYLILVSC